MIKVRCKGCAQEFEVKTSSIGTSCKCPKCGTQFVLQAQGAENGTKDQKAPSPVAKFASGTLNGAKEKPTQANKKSSNARPTNEFKEKGEYSKPGQASSKKNKFGLWGGIAFVVVILLIALPVIWHLSSTKSAVPEEPEAVEEEAKPQVPDEPAPDEPAHGEQEAKPVPLPENKEYAVELPGNVALEFIRVEKGSFIMGSPDGEDRRDDEKMHKVYISKDYFLGKYEVTQEQWLALMPGGNPSCFKDEAKLPVEQVSWEMAMQFCERLTEQERNARRLPDGYVYTLPTEAQWEYAASGGARRVGYEYSGGNDLDSVGWFADNSGQSTHPVGGKKPNELGIYDMSGNVSEWCLDCSEDNNGVETDTYLDEIQDPCCKKGVKRVFRGGAWQFKDCRVAVRSAGAPQNQFSSIGFRVALAPDIGQIAYRKEKQKISPEVEEEEKKQTLPGNVELEPVNREDVQGESAEDDGAWLDEKEKRIYLPGGVTLELIKVSKGHFMMGGSNPSGYNRPHRVFITKSFYLGKYEVTQEQWQAIMGSNPSGFKNGDKFPVENVSWNEAMDFCRRLTERERGAGRLPEGYAYSLPTEAQWEYAARSCGKYGNRPYSGGNHLDSVAWYSGNSGGTSHIVGTKRPNELGFYDMTGNVWEWCLDCSTSNASAGSASSSTYIGDTKDPYCSSGPYRIFRGGSWSNFSERCNVSYRLGRDPTRGKVNDVGFRVALSYVINRINLPPSFQKSVKEVPQQKNGRQGRSNPRTAGDGALVVNTNKDVANAGNGMTSLRNALARATSSRYNSVIKFADNYDINLTSPLVIQDDVTIDGVEHAIKLKAFQSWLLNVARGEPTLKNLQLLSGEKAGIALLGTNQKMRLYNVKARSAGENAWRLNGSAQLLLYNGSSIDNVELNNGGQLHLENNSVVKNVRISGSASIVGGDFELTGTGYDVIVMNNGEFQTKGVAIKGLSIRSEGLFLYENGTLISGTVVVSGTVRAKMDVKKPIVDQYAKVIFDISSWAPEGMDRRYHVRDRRHYIDNLGVFGGGSKYAINVSKAQELGLYTLADRVERFTGSLFLMVDKNSTGKCFDMSEGLIMKSVIKHNGITYSLKKINGILKLEISKKVVEKARKNRREE